MSAWFVLLLAIFVGIWLTMFDADFITFSYDVHRQLLGNNHIVNKTVWIVGASSGIGEHLAYELANTGCTRMILSSRREEQLQRVKTQILKSAGNANDMEIVVKPLDLVDFASKPAYSDEYVASLMKEIPFERVDVLVLNSGMIQIGYAIDNDIGIVQRVSQINTVGPIACIQAMIRYWQQHEVANGGQAPLYQVAVTSSIAGKLGSPRQSAYSMSKFAINGYLETLRMELMDENIAISTFNPGHVELNEYSLDARGSSVDGDQVKRGSNAKNSERMTLRRCAQLYVTVLEYGITDSVVSTQPVLAFTYIKQYLPALYYPLTKVLLPVFDPKYKKPNEEVK